MDKKTQRIIACVCCCPCWFNYFSFLHNTIRGCEICCNVFNGISNTLCKVLFIVFMSFCGFGIVQCVLCVIGCLHCAGTPFQNYQGAGGWVDAFHKLVYEPSCEFEGKITDILNKIFNKPENRIKSVNN